MFLHRILKLLHSCAFQMLPLKSEIITRSSKDPDTDDMRFNVSTFFKLLSGVLALNFSFGFSLNSRARISNPLLMMSVAGNISKPKLYCLNVNIYVKPERREGNH